jgi:hypothetical protein
VTTFSTGGGVSAVVRWELIKPQGEKKAHCCRSRFADLSSPYPQVIGSAALIFFNRTGKRRLVGSNKSQPPLGLS